MSYQAIEVAKYIVTYGNQKNKSVSNLKLQKILYFAWVDFYKETRRHLFTDEICAWNFGPVIPEVYYRFCTYAGAPIIREYEVEIDSKDADILNDILDRYLDLSASTLVNLTHQNGSAWDQVYRNGEGKRSVIPFPLIAELECEP